MGRAAETVGDFLDLSTVEAAPTDDPTTRIIYDDTAFLLSNGDGDKSI